MKGKGRKDKDGKGKRHRKDGKESYERNREYYASLPKPNGGRNINASKQYVLANEDEAAAGADRSRHSRSSCNGKGGVGSASAGLKGELLGEMAESEWDNISKFGSQSSDGAYSHVEGSQFEASQSGEETWDELEAQARKLGFVKDDDEDVKDDVVARLAQEAASARSSQKVANEKQGQGEKPYSPTMMPTLSPEPSASPFALVSETNPMDARVQDGNALLSVPAPASNITTA